MSTLYTGRDGVFFFGGKKQAKCTNWSIESTVNILDRTALGDSAVKNLLSLKSFSGSASLIYYSDDTDISNLLGRVFRTTDQNIGAEVDLRLGSTGDSNLRRIKFKALITNASINASAGEVVTAEISFISEGTFDSDTVLTV